jgi:hypothetical protein
MEVIRSRPLDDRYRYKTKDRATRTLVYSMALDYSEKDLILKEIDICLTIKIGSDSHCVKCSGNELSCVAYSFVFANADAN